MNKLPDEFTRKTDNRISIDYTDWIWSRVNGKISLNNDLMGYTIVDDLKGKLMVTVGKNTIFRINTEEGEGTLILNSRLEYRMLIPSLRKLANECFFVQLDSPEYGKLIRKLDTHLTQTKRRKLSVYLALRKFLNLKKEYDL